MYQFQLSGYVTIVLFLFLFVSLKKFAFYVNLNL